MFIFIYLNKPQNKEHQFLPNNYINIESKLIFFWCSIVKIVKCKVKNRLIYKQLNKIIN